MKVKMNFNENGDIIFPSNQIWNKSSNENSPTQKAFVHEQDRKFFT